jgi:integrase
MAEEHKRPRGRRGRGEGGIYQRADGLWVGSVSLGYDENGKRLRRTVYGQTKKEAMEELRKAQEATGRKIESISLAGYLDRWLAGVKPSVEPHTYAQYEQHCRLHIKPHVGYLKLAELRPAHVKGLYAGLAERAVSAALIRKVGTTLTVALGEAVNEDLLAGNPAVGIRKPKAEKFQPKPLDPDQLAAFLREAEKDRLHALYVLAVDTGARPGELFALTWPDIDFERRMVRINKSLEEKGGHLRVKETKTKKSRRSVEVSTETMAVLNEYRKRQLAAGHLGGAVFTDTEGGHLRIGNVWRDSFVPICKRAGLPVCEKPKRKKAGKKAEATAAGPTANCRKPRGSGFRLYDLRHTCATLLLLAEVPAKIVSERLGHSTITLTLDTYSHVLPTMQARAAVVMGGLIGLAKRAQG